MPQMPQNNILIIKFHREKKEKKEVKIKNDIYQKFKIRFSFWGI